MFPDFSYILNYLFDTPQDNFLRYFKTYGFFLFLGILLANWLFSQLVLSKEEILEQKIQPVFFKNLFVIVAFLGIVGAKSMFGISLNG